MMRGAGLDPASLLAAYAAGCFPMDEPGARGPVALYEADPRAVLPVDGLRVPRSVARARRHAGYEIRVDGAFREVLEACAEGRSGVWLTPRLIDAYARLHLVGHAHSVEAWRDGRICGGLFGVALGALFTSESMFHRASDAGSVALAAAGDLVRDGGFLLWDIQMASHHTLRFGAEEIGRAEYRARLHRALAADAWLPEP
ncbi:MAG: leucyl/phenylalanyl-tRNA---protein transferase [Miltoncostaeaceae bacterium]|nr:leucyl/phenylalanyl-tRNA---protein transferase [Miltoncostaeaceae bacterium]